MSCKAARSDLFERELGALDAAGHRRLRAHLDGCAACRKVARQEELLSAGLARLAAEVPPPVAVDARVRAWVARAGAPDRRDLDTAGLAWAFAAGIALLALLGGVAAVLFPEAGAWWPGVRALGGGLLRAALAVAQFAWEVLEPAAQPAVFAVRSLAARLADPALRAAGHAVVATAVLGSLSLSLWLVGREFTRTVPTASEES